MNDKIKERLTKLTNAINKSDNPDFARLEVFVELLDHIGITPRFIIEDVTGNIMGVQLEVQSGKETTLSAALPTEIPMRAIGVVA